jgi:hypothetical protein
MSLLARLRRRVNGGEQDVHDFLGLVQLDAQLNVLVLPDHVATLLRLSGTDYLHLPEAEQMAIIERWRDTLNNAQMSIQLVVDRRPLRWDRRGGFLDLLRAQIEEARLDRDGKPDADHAWRMARFERQAAALLGGELEAIGMYPPELRMYAVIRYAFPDSESFLRLSGEAPVFLPSPREWRFWERIEPQFGGAAGAARWRERRLAAARALSGEVQRFLAYADRIPGLDIVPASALEMSQLLHLLWLDDKAYDEWLSSEEELEEVIIGDIAVADALDSLDDDGEREAVDG